MISEKIDLEPNLAASTVVKLAPSDPGSLLRKFLDSWDVELKARIVQQLADADLRRASQARADCVRLLETLVDQKPGAYRCFEVEGAMIRLWRDSAFQPVQFAVIPKSKWEPV